MQCCYCGEAFGRGKSPKTKHGDRYYHADCLGQYLAVRAWLHRDIEQPPLPPKFTAKMRNRSRTQEMHKYRMKEVRIKERIERKIKDRKNKEYGIMT